MDLYESVSYELSQRLTSRYSSSFSLSTRLFSEPIRPHIYAIYGLVRIADEIVDTYQGSDKRVMLDDLETETYKALGNGYSANPIVHAFVQTARHYTIEKELIEPFFESMRIDADNSYAPTQYRTYIYGSAEVVGLMCLRVFCDGDEKMYRNLSAGASSLGAAYQKINFLRDFAADYHELGRVYFPDVTFEDFDDATRDAIITDIQKDMNHARPALAALPTSARKAVASSYVIYAQLLAKLATTPARIIKTRRIRISGLRKAQLIAVTLLKKGAV